MALSTHAAALVEKLNDMEGPWDTKDLYDLARQVRQEEVNRLALDDVKEALSFLAEREGDRIELDEQGQRKGTTLRQRR